MNSLCLVSSFVRWGYLTRLPCVLTAHNFHDVLTDQIRLVIYSNGLVNILLIWDFFWHSFTSKAALDKRFHFKRISSHFSHSWSIIFLHLFSTHVFLSWLEMLCIYYLRCPKAVKRKIPQLTHVCWICFFRLRKKVSLPRVVKSALNSKPKYVQPRYYFPFRHMSFLKPINMIFRIKGVAGTSLYFT